MCGLKSATGKALPAYSISQMSEQTAVTGSHALLTEAFKVCVAAGQVLMEAACVGLVMRTVAGLVPYKGASKTKNKKRKEPVRQPHSIVTRCWYLTAWETKGVSEFK